MTEFDNDWLAENYDESDIPYCHLVSDNDGHWYIIEDGADQEFLEWVKCMETGEESQYDFSQDRIVGGPGSVYFREDAIFVKE